MQFKWIESSEGQCVQAGEYIGYVVYIGDDLHGNKMYDATAYSKVTKEAITSKVYSYMEDAIQCVEKAIRRATQ